MLRQRECETGWLVWDSERPRDKDSLWLFSGDKAYYFADTYVDGEELKYPPATQCEIAPVRGGIAKVACIWHYLTGCLVDAQESDSFPGAIAIDTATDTAHITLHSGFSLVGIIIDPAEPVPSEPLPDPLPDPPLTEPPEEYPGIEERIKWLEADIADTAMDLAELTARVEQVVGSGVIPPAPEPPAGAGDDEERLDVVEQKLYEIDNRLILIEGALGDQDNTEPPPSESDYKSHYVLFPQGAGREWLDAASTYLLHYRATSGQSADDAGLVHGSEHVITAINPTEDVLTHLAQKSPFAILDAIDAETPDILAEILGARVADGDRYGGVA